MTRINLEPNPNKPLPKKLALSLALHLKKSYELSLKSVGEIPELDEPTEEQKQWVLFRLKNDNTWPNVPESKIGDTKNWI